MKYLIVLALAFCIQVAVSKDLTFPQIVRKWAEQRVPYSCQCINTTTVVPVTLDNWIHYGEFAKCGRLMCCIDIIYEGLGIVGTDGEIVKDKFLEYTSLPQEQALEVYEKCAQLKGSHPRCKNAYVIDQCAYELIKAKATQ